MKILWAEQALTHKGWQQAVRIAIRDDGRIDSIKAGTAPEGRRLDCALPAPANLHSHAFQRAMAGLTERRGTGAGDSFWTWRETMYRFLDLLTPEDVEAIAAFAQMEMLEAGFAAVGEFHYLHHAPGGQAYADPAEMSARIFAAREASGIGLTHLPVLYMQGGCDGRALSGGQLRFGHDLEGYGRLLAALEGAAAALPRDCALGIAPHSLRAVSREALDHLPELAAGRAVHIHIAEQQAEVTEVIAHLGARPVTWLLNIFDIGPEWCLIHATWMSPEETRGLAATGAVAGLCPVTEANLGDGIFDGARFLTAGGRFGLGSDSNIRIDLFEELRLLEYSQRLRDHARAVLAPEGGSVGRALFEGAAIGGAQALGRQGGALAPGHWADIVEIDTDCADLDGLSGDMLLDALIFARADGAVKNLWSAGRHLVTDGRHLRREAIARAYRSTVTRLRGAL